MYVNVVVCDTDSGCTDSKFLPKDLQTHEDIGDGPISASATLCLLSVSLAVGCVCDCEPLASALARAHKRAQPRASQRKIEEAAVDPKQIAWQVGIVRDQYGCPDSIDSTRNNLRP